MKEEDIRKRETFNQYLKLVEKDVEKFFDFNALVDIKCPACGKDDFIYEFEKLRFKFVSCKNCSTLFVNPRPSFETLKEFYLNSPSTSFWVNKFFKPVADVRRKEIFKPRAEYISKIINNNEQEWIIGDIGAGFGLFLEELRKIQPDNRYIAIEPSVEMANICNTKELEVISKCLEEIGNDIDLEFNLLTAFELFEHLFDPESFLRDACSLLKQGGYLFVTTLNSKGFDILLHWERSKGIAPPQHLNFFNPASIKYLLPKLNLEIVEITTPGKLDWDIVDGMITNENMECGRFWNLLAKEGSDKCKTELQEWISRNNLSSHMSILMRKSSS
jgi:SAM-dependent methyltransferase